MPAWSGKLTNDEVDALVAYIQSLPSPNDAGQASPDSRAAKRPVYEAGDDVLFSLPTGRPVARHGMYVNFAHRFPYDPAVSGTSRGAVLFGLDGLALPSFGLGYGLTDKVSVRVWRSPSLIGRPIQLMAAFQVADEHRGSPLTLSLRVSVEGQDNFRKNFTENVEAIVARSVTSRAQIYFVPTISFNDRPLAQGGFRSQAIPNLPGTHAFSLGAGGALDVRPTVALVGEIIPTLAGRDALGIHRPAYSFGIQKKILRHAFTFGFSNSPGTTISQRAGTRASFLGLPDADTPKGLFLGFNLTRQVR